MAQITTPPLVHRRAGAAERAPASGTDPPRRPRVPRWVGRGLGGAALLLLALAGVGAAYQAVASARDAAAYPAPGRLVDVGGHRLHIDCRGQGAPMVVLESALGAGSATWARVQPALAASTRVCAYDRAGEGWSDPGPEPRDAGRIAAELHTLLAGAGEPGPYVLVGHSFGGLYARAYAAAHPEDVVGVVLIDASHPDQWSRSPDGPGVQRANAQSAAVAPWLARLGLLRLTGYVAVDPALPARQRAELRAQSDATRTWEGYRAEFRAVDATTAQVRAAGGLGDTPLAVLTATEHGFPAGMERLHQGLQAELTALSTQSVHRVLPGATHVSPVHDPEQAGATAEAIRLTVEAARTGAAPAAP
jgi:pimeloyl-ACP methyl ester carboxylesterase